MKTTYSRNGQVELLETEIPELRDHFVLIRTEYSAISPGTELALIQKKSNTTLGNSAVGIVQAAGAGVKGIEEGMRVACYGGPYVKHAEYLLVPKHLAVPVPPEVDPEEAAFAGIGAIAIHALRQSGLQFGEVAAVIGLGILGQLIAQIALAAAYQVEAFDVLERRCHAWQQVSRIPGRHPAEGALEERIAAITGGKGADCVLLCAGSSGQRLMDDGIRLLRDRGTLVIVGDPLPAFDRAALFAKEASIRISRAGGPGRYDPHYEKEGVDYPYGYVRWTEGRNTAEFVRLLADRRIRVGPLITHRYDYRDIERAYAFCREFPSESLGVLIQYNH